MTVCDIVHNFWQIAPQCHRCITQWKFRHGKYTSTCTLQQILINAHYADTCNSFVGLPGFIEVDIVNALLDTSITFEGAYTSTRTYYVIFVLLSLLRWSSFTEFRHSATLSTCTNRNLYHTYIGLQASRSIIIRDLTQQLSTLLMPYLCIIRY
jgi:hypothetical protein